MADQGETEEKGAGLWARLTARCWREQRGVMLGYPEPSGLMALRRAISGHLRANRGVICKSEEIFIVNGAQEAFNRIGNTLLDPGDRVWFENPGAIGARNSFILYGSELVPVPVDNDGLVVERGRVRAVVVDSGSEAVAHGSIRWWRSTTPANRCARGCLLFPRFVPSTWATCAISPRSGSTGIRRIRYSNQRTTLSGRKSGSTRASSTM